jgi:hypothetical protein
MDLRNNIDSPKYKSTQLLSSDTMVKCVFETMYVSRPSIYDVDPLFTKITDIKIVNESGTLKLTREEAINLKKFIDDSLAQED